MYAACRTTCSLREDFATAWWPLRLVQLLSSLLLWLLLLDLLTQLLTPLSHHLPKRLWR
jgi:hypothetical protein